MLSQATYFKQVEEYDKTLSLIDILIALDPQNQTYKNDIKKYLKNITKKTKLEKLAYDQLKSSIADHTNHLKGNTWLQTLPD